MSKLESHSSGRVPFYRRPLVIAAFLLALIVAGVVTFFILRSNSSPDSNTPKEGTSSSRPIEGSTSSPQTPDPDNNPATPDEPDRKVTPFEGEDPNLNNELTGRIAYHGIEQNNLVITASIDQYLQSGGECRLELLSGDQKVHSATLSATADITTSVCGPFRVSLKNLSPGEYNIRIIVTSNNKTGLITGQTTI